MACSEITRKGLQCSREGKYAGCCSQHMDMKLDGKSQGITLKNVVKSNDGKHKYVAIFDVNGREKKTSFGAEGYGDFIKFSQESKEEGLIHRERYWDRHTKDLKSLDLTSPGWLSLFILWNKPTLKESIDDYKRRFNI
jgi:hypothetical protein